MSAHLVTPGTGDLRAEAIALSLSGTSFRVRTSAGTVEMRTPLLGRFNVQNVLAAFGACLGLGLDPQTAARGIEVVASQAVSVRRSHLESRP